MHIRFLSTKTRTVCKLKGDDIHSFAGELYHIMEGIGLIIFWHMTSLHGKLKFEGSR